MHYMTCCVYWLAKTSSTPVHLSPVLLISFIHSCCHISSLIHCSLSGHELQECLVAMWLCSEACLQGREAEVCAQLIFRQLQQLPPIHPVLLKRRCIPDAHIPQQLTHLCWCIPACMCKGSPNRTPYDCN